VIFLAVYLEARLKLLKFRYAKVFIQLLTFLGALFVCVTRVSEYHNRESDVIGGALIGLIIALFITLRVGRVLWEYGTEHTHKSDFDLKFNQKKK
jgi:membrane-associated phospholipid phosphatase